MPELPEVESIRKQLEPRLIGQRIDDLIFDPSCRRHKQPDVVIGRTIKAVNRRGKYLIMPTDGDLELIGHLGMTGSLRWRGENGWEPDHYVRASIFFSSGDILDYRDVRKFGGLAGVKAGEYKDLPTLDKMGPEPLSEDFTPEGLYESLKKTRLKIKTALLNQRIVAGVGNIYADEALWRSKISPTRRQVSAKRCVPLHKAIVEVLTESISREGTTFRDYQMVNGESGKNVDFLDCYGRAGLPCNRCGTILSSGVVDGRGTTWCKNCQT